MLFVVSSILLALGMLPSVRPAGSAYAQAEDAAQIRDLAERLLTNPSYGPYILGTATSTVQLFVGQLPPDMPFTVDTPPGGRIVGSDERRLTGQSAGIDVAIEAPGSPAEILAFYDQALPRAGLSIAPSSTFGGGFQSGAGKRLDTYCMGEDGPWLSLTATQRTNTTSDVRLTITMPAAMQSASQSVGYIVSPCSAITRPGYSYSTPGPSLPRLSGPTGVSMQQIPTSYGPGQSSSAAIATTEMSVAELEAFFAGQIAAAGWNRLTGGSSGPLAWSTWALPDDPDAQGFLYVLEAPGENRKQLVLQVQSSNPTGPGYPTVYYSP